MTKCRTISLPHAAALSLTFVLVSVTPIGARAQQPTAPPATIPTPEAVTRFSGALLASVKKQAQPLRITVRTLIIPNSVTTEIDHVGDVIVHVRAGDLVAIVDGKRVEQPIETSFVVPRVAKLAIETDRDSVIIQVVDVAPGDATRSTP